MSTTETIFVENIKCGGCMKSIKDALLPVAGVDTVTVDKESVVVTGADINRHRIIDKLRAIGYPEKGKNSLSKKTRSFVSCVIGKMS